MAPGYANLSSVFLRNASFPNRESPRSRTGPSLRCLRLLSGIPQRSGSAGARASGHRNAEALWEEALSHVQEGWLSQAAEFSPDGDIDFSPCGATDAAFRFVVSQGEKVRACDDPMHNMTILCTTGLTPITLPTWGHLAQIAKNIHHANIGWALRVCVQTTNYP